MTPEPQEIDDEPPATAAEWLEAAEIEWDSADSNAYQARVEAGLEPEAEAGG